MSVGIGIGFGQGHVTLGDASTKASNGEVSPTWSLRCWDTLDQVDHLILLPERALTMDSGWLEADLAEILAHSVINGAKGMTGVVGCVPLLTKAAVQSEGSDGWSSGRRRSLDWSLVNPGRQSPLVAIAASIDRSTSPAVAAAPSSVAAAAKEERNRMLRERQNEERQRKLEELKQHALATQKFREQQEEERRRRMEEQRLRDVERRTQVEERKRAILEAERERREAILRRSEDRGMRQELKRRNDKSSIAFAFGSSTPRMLEPAETVSSAYWGARRATSTTNVMSASSHGRMTMNDAASASSSNGLGTGSSSHKRASSVFGLDQNQGEDLMTQSMSAVLGGRRRRTDLLPTIPVHRDSDRSPRSHASSSSRGSVSRSTGLRSGDVTPSSPTRPLSALSQVSSASTTMATSIASHGHVRARTAPAGGRKPRPVSIAGTEVSLAEAARSSHRASRESVNAIQQQQRNSRSKEAKDKENEAAKSRPSSAQPRPARARSADQRNKEAGAQEKKADAKRTTRDVKPAKPSEPAKNAKPAAKEAKPKVVVKSEEKTKDETKTVSQPSTPLEIPVVNVKSEIEEVKKEEEIAQEAPLESDNQTEENTESDVSTPVEEEAPVQQPVVAPVEPVTSGATTPSEGSVTGEAPAVPPGRKIISSEEEAKAALAEKRRLAREQMEREAERERQRLEEEKRLEEERLRQEELEQRLAEEEMERLAQEARKAEEERLEKAIEETKRREEEERQRREEEARAKAEKEQQEKKAREDAERARKENEERLRREEEERQERRRRVEAIMARTRGKTSGATKNSADVLSSSGQSSSDLTNVGMSNSVSQPDLLGDLVNKANGGVGTSSSSGSLQALVSPTEPAAESKKNGFHQEANDEMTNGSSGLPDVSNVIDSATPAANLNNNNSVNEEHLALAS